MQKYFIETKKLFKLAIPVLFAQIAQISIGFVNTIMIGAFSTTDMASISIGTSIWLPIILLGHGILLSLIPIISQLNGSGNRIHIANQIKQAYLLVIIISILIMFFLYNIGYFLIFIPNINKFLVLKSDFYLKIILWNTPGYLFFQVLRCKCEGLSLTRPCMIISFISLLLFIPLNYSLINGYWIFPRLGGIGSGFSIIIIYWIMFFIIKLWISHSMYFNDIRIINRLIKPNKNILYQFIKIGFPIALSIFFEVTLFTLVSLFISPMGVEKIASHQIALNFSSLIFVFPFSFSVAVTIRIGHYLRYRKKTIIISWCAQIIGIIISIITSFISIFFRNNISSLYSSNQEIIYLSSYLILLSGIYQISDSIQVIGCGILKGYKDTVAIFFITFFSYWMLGFPIGYILSITNWIVSHPMGPAGFWIGFIVGLTTSAILIIYRIIYLQKFLY
ncbi:MATE family efflux transporter [Enterobacteriaceae endosymbiont of Plateumaris consimilis]|uniref:MATE family efflux transporter n=1 Tax=Enterobacteriaceae endosymbiont of Plateumaris consimilis TaxID=2675794 RepID=UPI00144959C5|nr:MATE family efflux transporter [Enterobacteriaceae endosymbiont of Plateumaris consimilis]QJC28528.1 MATE family efflux transporter [Enterobacteriaceae endosymbiont of Plateumaris consimilis]